MLICWYTSIPSCHPAIKVPIKSIQALTEVNIPLYHGGLAKGLHWQDQRADKAVGSLPGVPIKQHRLIIHPHKKTGYCRSVPSFTAREGRSFIL